MTQNILSSFNNRIKATQSQAANNAKTRRASPDLTLIIFIFVICFILLLGSIILFGDTKIGIYKDGKQLTLSQWLSSLCQP